jgi:hypothetical protein
MLQDQSAEPCDLRLQYLIDITDNFSGKREVGRGGFGVVYKVSSKISFFPFKINANQLINKPRRP